MNYTKVKLLILASVLTLPCCVVNNEISSIKAPSIPDSVDISEVNNKSKSKDSGSFNSEDLSYDHIIAKDLNDKYFVGETFDSVFRLNLTLVRNGETRDISSIYSSYSFSLKDSKGNELDPTKPFEKAGTYKATVYMTKAASIKSNELTLNVVDSPKNELKEKTPLPEFMNLQKLEHTYGTNRAVPTKGNPNVLVVPVEITDYPFNSMGYGEKYLEKITALFNGDGSKDTNYWESVTSFYKKASVGQLNFNFEIGDVYKCGYSTSDFFAGMTSVSSIAKKVLDEYTKKHGAGSTMKFDNDKDGHVDCVWLVYSAPDYETGAYGATPGADLFWAFVQYDPSFQSDMSNPTPNNVAWASIDFLNKDVGNDKVDPHIHIHETGHTLSLPDLYSYDIGGAQALGAQGGLAMQDYNIGDQDSFSKLALGWASPYVVTGDCIVKIKPNEATADCIILADSWNGTAFDEYILLDLQTPTGVNALDSSTKYGYRPLYYSIPGIRAYHVDSRLGEFKYVTQFDGFTDASTGVQPISFADEKTFYLPDEYVEHIVKKGKLEDMSMDPSLPFDERPSAFTMINANSTTWAKISDGIYKNARLLTLVGADNRHPELDDCTGSNASLFVKGTSWTVNAKTAKFFTSEEGDFNNGDKFSYAFTVLDVSNEGATIQFRKIK